MPNTATSPDWKPPVSSDELLDEIRRLGSELGKPPTATEMNAFGKFSSDTYKRRWGSFRQAVKGAFGENDDVSSVKDERTPRLSRKLPGIASLLDEASNDRKVLVAENRYFGKPKEDKRFSFDVFVIMPFAEDFKSIYEDHIKVIVEGLNLTVNRADNISTGYPIMQNVWSALNACRLVIADCTSRNANVFYELGIAHTLNKHVVIITQDMHDILFDINQFRAIKYEVATYNGAVHFKKELGKEIMARLSD